MTEEKYPRWENRKGCVFFLKLSCRKAFFGAFIDKEIAYRMPHALGLVTFGDKVTVELEITREFESFATLFGEISKLQPATHLLDAVVRASSLINSFCNEKKQLLAPNYKRRILCLSDGEVSSKNFKSKQHSLLPLTLSDCRTVDQRRRLNLL